MAVWSQIAEALRVGTQAFVSSRRGEVDTVGIARFFVELAVAVERQGKVSDAELVKLHHVLYALTVRACDSEEHSDYRTDPSHVGYARRTVGDVDVFVPFHLCSHFPDGTVLGTILLASRAIAFGLKNPICVSGSATFLGISKAISDLDFCEYDITQKQNPDQKLKRILNYDREDLYVTSIKCGSIAFLPPWPSDEGALDVQMLRELRVLNASIKIEGAFTSDMLGLLPISNLILPINVSSPEEGCAQKSFAFQEAVIVRAGHPPRALVNVSSLGQYLNFLRMQADKFLNSNPLKSLKRSLSFCLLTGLKEPAEAIVKVLQSHAAELLMLADRQDHLDSLRRVDLTFDTYCRSTPAAHPRISQDTVVYARALVHPLMVALAMDMRSRIAELYAAAA